MLWLFSVCILFVLFELSLFLDCHHLWSLEYSPSPSGFSYYCPWPSLPTFFYLLLFIQLLQISGSLEILFLVFWFYVFWRSITSASISVGDLWPWRLFSSARILFFLSSCCLLAFSADLSILTFPRLLLNSRWSHDVFFFCPLTQNSESCVFYPFPLLPRFLILTHPCVPIYSLNISFSVISSLIYSIFSLPKNVPRVPISLLFCVIIKFSKG